MRIVIGYLILGLDVHMYTVTVKYERVVTGDARRDYRSATVVLAHHRILCIPSAAPWAASEIDYRRIHLVSDLDDNLRDFFVPDKEPVLST